MWIPSWIVVTQRPVILYIFYVFILIILHGTKFIYLVWVLVLSNHNRVICLGYLCAALKWRSMVRFYIPRVLYDPRETFTHTWVGFCMLCFVPVSSFRKRGSSFSRQGAGRSYSQNGKSNSYFKRNVEKSRVPVTNDPLPTTDMPVYCRI